MYDFSFYQACMGGKGGGRQERKRGHENMKTYVPKGGLGFCFLKKVKKHFSLLLALSLDLSF
jgi:hypothetical protein